MTRPIRTRWVIAALLLAVAATQATVGQTLPDTQSNHQLIAEELVKRGIVGYADRLTAQAGQTIRFMVSSELPSYRVDIVRMVMGDADSTGPGIKETVVPTPVNKEYPGKRQAFPFGSYVSVPDDPALRLTGSFTITAWIGPTTPGVSAGVRSAAGLVGKWSESDQSGYGLMIDDSGALALWLSRPGAAPEKISTGVPLRQWIPQIPGAFRPRPQGTNTAWYFVGASFDAATGRVVLYQQPVSSMPVDPSRAVVERTVASRSLRANTVPLVVGAYWAAEGRPVGYYNGKVDSPRLYNRALTLAQLQAMPQGTIADDPVAAWDFSKEIGTDKVIDVSPRNLHGVAINMPTRAVTGYRWSYDDMDFKHAPDQYSAMYFHDDDLEDAKWEVGFEYAIPADLKSGVYAARLRTTTSEDYVPFFVRPKQGTATARIALIIPTFSYLAYAATGSGTGGFRALSLYSSHNDGTGFTYSSRLRPITNMRPKITTNNPWQFIADTHITDWLEAKQFDYDVITDEDIHFEGESLLKLYKVVMTGTHPEYTSRQMLTAFEKYMHGGGRVMYMGGNGFYWVTSYDPKGRFIEVRRRDGTEHWNGAPGEAYHSTTGEMGGLWRFRGIPPQQLFAVGFTAQGFDRNSPYRRMPGSFDPRAAFIFQGLDKDELIGNHPSLVLTFGAGGSELDRVDYALGSPPHTLILAQSFGHSDAYQHVVEEVNTSDSRQGGTINPLVHADMAFAEYPNGGAIFSTGAIAWSGSLYFNNYNNNVSRITENVLRRFASDEPIPFPVRTTTGATQ